MPVFNGGKPKASWARHIEDSVNSRVVATHATWNNIKQFTCKLVEVNDELHALVYVYLYGGDTNTIYMGASAVNVTLSDNAKNNAIHGTEADDISADGRLWALDAGVAVNGDTVYISLTPSSESLGSENLELDVIKGSSVIGTPIAIVTIADGITRVQQLTYDVHVSPINNYRQWGCNIIDNSIAVSSGSLAWGGGHNCIWPSGVSVSTTTTKVLALTLASGSKKYIIWFTKCAPCPLLHCPKSPDTENACEASSGDPSEFTPDIGSVDVFDTTSRQSGWTDFRVIAEVYNTDGLLGVNQILTSEITVNAIVWPGETPEEPDPGDTPNPFADCSSADSEDFPSSVDDEEFPGDPDDFGGGGLPDEDEEKFPSKVDVCW